MNLFECIHRSVMEGVRIGNAMVEEVAGHCDEDAGADEEDVCLGGGVGVGAALFGKGFG